MGFQIEKIWMTIMVVAICLSNGRIEAQVEVGFYSGSCPTAELIIQEEVEKALTEDPGVGADLLRMFFHDCFASGCDASILLDSTANNSAEKDAKVNLTLEGFEIIDNIKERLEAVCNGVVSCADIIAFAARDSVAHYGGVHFKVAGGRRDGRVSRAADASILPSADQNLSQLTKLFISRGLSQSDMIILSGAHTIGISHCDAFAGQLYDVHADGYEAMDEKYAAHLRQRCPPGSNNTVVMNPHSQFVFDNRYYKNLLSRHGSSSPTEPSSLHTVPRRKSGAMPPTTSASSGSSPTPCSSSAKWTSSPAPMARSEPIAGPSTNRYRHSGLTIP